MQIKAKNVSRHTGDSKPVKQEVNGTVSPFSIPGIDLRRRHDDDPVVGHDEAALDSSGNAEST